MKQKFRSFLASILCVLMLVSAVPAGAAAAFSDVRETDWHYTYITQLERLGIISGYPDGTFRPSAKVTAGEALKLILLAAGCGEQISAADHWAGGYLKVAVSSGFLDKKDVSDLNAGISRRIIAKCAAGALQLRQSAMLSPFSDTQDGYVLALWSKGILTGSDEDGELVYRPEDGMTRAELAAMVWRMHTTDVHAGQIKYGSYWVDVYDNIAKNPYDSGAFYKDESGVMQYGGKVSSIMHGVDVSRYQGDIDWQKVARSGVDFAIIRLGYRGYTTGSVNLDANYRKNIEGAVSAGLKVGVYFFSQAVSEAEAEEEARFVLSNLGDYTPEWVVFDWETIGTEPARTDNVNVRTLCESAVTFCETVKDAGFSPMVYFNKYDGYIKYDLSRLAEYDFWYAEYSSAPNFLYDFRIWQYTSSGKVDGIDGKVDMNICIKP